MGVQFFPKLERDIPGLPWVEGKSLAFGWILFDLDGIAERLFLTPLATFSYMPSAGAGEAPWYPPEEGLRTVRGLLDHLRRETLEPADDAIMEDLGPDADPAEWQDGVIGDLEAMERVLEAAVAQGVRFHLYMSA